MRTRMAWLVIKWALLSLFNLVLKYGIAWPLTPVIVLFAKPNGWLPDWLFWFQTNDASLDGDEGWKNGTRPFADNSGFCRYVNRCFWLWRNSLYGFNQSVLAVDLTRDHLKLHVIGDPSVGNGPGGKSGLVRRCLVQRGKILAWQWYYIRRLKHWPNRCIRINLGWKLFSFGNRPKAHMALSAWVNRFMA